MTLDKFEASLVPRAARQSPGGELYFDIGQAAAIVEEAAGHSFALLGADCFKRVPGGFTPVEYIADFSQNKWEKDWNEVLRSSRDGALRFIADAEGGGAELITLAFWGEREWRKSKRRIGLLGPLPRMSVPRAQSSAVKLRDVPLTRQNRIWAGVFKARDELVALAFLRCGDSFEWVKSSTASAELPVEFFWNAYEEPTDVRLGCLVGGARVAGRVRLPRAGEPRLQVTNGSVKTGRVEALAICEGEPATAFWVLLLKRQDVAFGRDRVWHLRPSLCEGLEEPLRTVLGKGRSGRIKSA